MLKELPIQRMPPHHVRSPINYYVLYKILFCFFLIDKIYM